MPYIEPKDRSRFDPHIDELVNELEITNPISPGDVNYIVSRLIWKLWMNNRSYTLANNLIGALECIKAEFLRRFLAPYEDVKIQENGDVKL